MMQQLVVLGGTGDAYLICALAGAFERHHHVPVTVVLRSGLRAVADLFNVRIMVDDGLVARAEQNPEFQKTHDNILLIDGSPFYAHPCFVRSHIRVDKLTTKPDASQADMYRMILRLSHDTPLALPRVPDHAPAEPGTALMVTESTSWPNTQPAFWSALAEALRAAGRHVTMNDRAWPLAELLARCAGTEWVIGPQCGVMSILCTGEFPCRKTLATPNIDGNRRPEYLADETYPYGYVTKFANTDYDVEEFKIAAETHAYVVAAIVGGANARRLWPHDPRPVTTISVPLTPGDFLDRLAVLAIKHDRLPPAGRAAIEREYLRHRELYRQTRLPPEAVALYEKLVDLHGANFDLLQQMVPAALNGGTGVEAHVAAVRSNRQRVALKREIDDACHSPYAEVKTYYG